MHKTHFYGKKIFNWKGNKYSYFFDQLMNISPHLIIDAVILSTALIITLILRTKGNAARKEKESKWLNAFILE